MHERPDITLVALPVLDHKLNLDGLNQRRAGFGNRIQALAYAAICRASGQSPYPPPSSEVITNKHSFNTVQTVRLDANHPAAEGAERSALEFKAAANGSGVRVFHLGLPKDEEGLEEIAGSRTPDFEEVMKVMCHPPCIGGNIPNSGLNQVRMTSVLREIDPQLRINFLTPSATIIDMLERDREEMQEILSVQKLDLSSSRQGLHIPVEFLHEESRSSTAMFNTVGPSVEEVRESLGRHQALLRHSVIFSPDPRYNLTPERTRLIPTSAAMNHVDLAGGQTLFLNQEELLRIGKHKGILPEHIDPDWLPAILNNGRLDTDALQVTNDRLYDLTRAMQDPFTKNTAGTNRERKRVAQIGRADGGILDLFASNEGMTALHTSGLSEATVDRTLDRAGSPRIARHLVETTGRGDAASAASLLDAIEPSRMIAWWKSRNPGTHVDFAHGQQDAFRMILPAIMSRIQAKLVHYSPDSNFFGAIDKDGYRRVLEYGTSIALRLASEFDERNSEPQILRDKETGTSSVIWKVPGTNVHFN